MHGIGFTTASIANKAGMSIALGSSNSRNGLMRKERTDSYASRAISSATEGRKPGMKQPWYTLPDR
jgi:hypothetical protein